MDVLFYKKDTVDSIKQYIKLSLEKGKEKSMSNSLKLTENIWTATGYSLK